MEIKEKKNKKTTVYLIITIVFMFLVIVGVSFAYFRAIFLGTKTSTINTGGFTVIFTEPAENLTLNDWEAIPMPGEELTFEPTFDFSITASTTATGTSRLYYDIYLVDQGIDNTITEDYFNNLMFYLTDGDDNLIFNSSYFYSSYNVNTSVVCHDYNEQYRDVHYLGETSSCGELKYSTGDAYSVGDDLTVNHGSSIGYYYYGAQKYSDSITSIDLDCRAKTLYTWDAENSIYVAADPNDNPIFVEEYEHFCNKGWVYNAPVIAPYTEIINETFTDFSQSREVAMFRGEMDITTGIDSAQTFTDYLQSREVHLLRDEINFANGVDTTGANGVRNFSLRMWLNHEQQYEDVSVVSSGNSHTASYDGKTYSFKLKIVATEGFPC